MAAMAGAAPQKPVLEVTGYVIDAELDPASHHLAATARVTFVPADDSGVVTFGLNNALAITRISDAAGRVLSGERSQNSTVRLTAPAPLPAGQPATWTFTYEGTLSGQEEGPVEGLKLAAIGSPLSYLLYPARWFPMTGLLTDRFTAEMHIRVPAGYTVIASGPQGEAHSVHGRQQFDFAWNRPGFPGTILAGKFEPQPRAGSIANTRVYLLADHAKAAGEVAESAARIKEAFTGLFGMPESGRMQVVELPAETLPAWWAPEIAAVSGTHLGDRAGTRLLANTIAHQWWGGELSPATLNDAWILNGMARYGELMYVEQQEGKAALARAVTDVAAGALAYDTVPLAQAARLEPFSPEFQSMTLEKGALVFHMLRGELGDEAFLRILRAALSQYTDRGITTAQFEKVAEAQSQQNLTPFFSQWLDGTGAPRFTNKYTVYRLGNNKGFRTIGEISQDLDLFNMPVELRIETDGRTVSQKVDIVGTHSQYVVDTFGRPRKITIDPDNWVLKNTPELEVRVAILRGQQLAAQGDSAGALAEYQKALQANPQSSLASYRIGELLFEQRNYQSSINSFRDCLNGDGDPRWTEVWAHIEIGRIFDLTGQRERALQEYRQALQTNDNTQGALNEARALLQTPYKRPETD